MKKMSRKLLTLLLVATMVFGCIPVVYGAAQDALSVEIITDKEEYAKGEEAKITLKFSNNGSATISNITGEIEVPKGIVLSKDCSTTVTLASISAGANQQVVLQGTVTDNVTDEDDNKTDGGGNKTGDASNVGVYLCMAIVAMAALSLTVSKKKGLKKLSNISVVVLILAAFGAMVPSVADAAQHTIKAEKAIKIGGEKAIITAEVTYSIEGEETDDNTGDDNTGDNNTGDNNTGNDNTGDDNTGDDTTGDNNDEVKPEVGTRVSVHDPSIVKDPETGMYYIFGSHMAWAKSKDLISWTTFTNNINKDFNTIFAEAAEWSALGGTQGSTTGKYEVSGNLWAPDVIWNEELGKWCMYMSVNGDYWYTSVVMLTSDSLEGDWTLVGPVVYSGFTSVEQAELTDFYDVYEGTDFPERYLENRNGNHTYGMNAIDPNVFYDEDGTLWMAYGSWFGGIYMLKLDESTGLRDYDYTYETVANTSDEYQGLKIAGGAHVSGEAPYIEKIGDYYYLFMSYGGLVANGGYNMRVFRSESATGPYVDVSGDDARYTAGTNNINGTVGIKLFGHYKWSYMKYGQVAQGHNSTFVDDDGKAYVIYHTRTNDGTEGHTVRVHQLFVNEDGWLVAAPYEYMGEKLEKEGYEKSEVLGTYEVLYHKQSIDYTNLECVTAKELTLNEDGTATGDYEGTWTMTENSPYVQLELNDVEYKGVFVEQYIEDYDKKTLCFTLLGENEVELWGSKYLTGEDAIQMSLDFGILTMPKATVTDIEFIAEGLYGTVATYSSSDTSIISNEGVVTRPEKDTVVTINATYKNGGDVVTKAWDVKVLGTTLVNGELLVGEFYTDEECNLSNAVEGTYRFPNPFNKNVINGLEIYNGASIEFDVKGTGSYLSNILSFQGGGRLYFTGGSYLGYNALGGFFDANVKNTDPWAAGTDYINGEAHIKISFTASGFEVYSNGELAYDSADLAAGDIKGGMDLSGFNNVTKWLNETAETIDFGWGSWWTDKFNGTISNVKCYVTPIVEEDTSDYVWYESFSKGDKSAWFAPTDGMINYITIKNDGTDRGNYVNAVTDDGSGNRSAYMTFDETANLTGNYKISMDVALTAGVMSNRSMSSFAIVGTDVNHVSNGEVTSGYILKLTNNPPADSSGNNNNYTKQDKWIINDAYGSEVTIPVGTWVTITADVSTTEGKAYVTIANADDSSVEYYKGVVIINGTGELGGIDVLIGRGVGKVLVDAIGVNLSEGFDFDSVKPEESLEAEATVTGTAYPDKNSTVTVTFTSEAGTEISDTCKVLINDTEVATNSVVNMVTVKSITFNGNVATVVLDVAAINGWHSVVGSYDIKLMNGTIEMSNATVEYAMEMSADTAYTAIVPTTNDKVKAYFKIEGTKMYVMTIIDGTIHCDGVTAGDTTYAWWNGIASQIYMTIDGTEYSIGSHVYNGQYANGIGWSMDGHTALYSLINADAANVTRSYMALGTFDNDADVDTGCILLNVVDLALADYTEETLAGKTITFCGFIGPNDGSGRFEAVDATVTYSASPIGTVATATGEVTGTAYPDKESEVTVTFTSTNNISGTNSIKVNGTTVTEGSTVDMVTVDSITYVGTKCTVVLNIAAINGWHSVKGSYDVALYDGETQLATKNVSYAMEMSGDTAYTAIAPTTNESVKAYFKVEGTKMYVMTIIDGTIHCDGIAAGGTTYAWWNGIASQIYMTIDGTEYSVGSHVYNGQYSNGIGWAMDGHTADYSLINADAAKVTRSYMALGTFNDDTDVDTGCILLNVVDLSLAGYTEETLTGKTITFCGFIGPNDGSGRFEAVTDTEEYVLD